MKWNKAIKLIEDALEAGQKVEIRYHRKWTRNPNEFKWSMVESVSEYNWNNEICKAVNTIHDQLTEGTHIIDEVNIWKGK